MTLHGALHPDVRRAALAGVLAVALLHEGTGGCSWAEPRTMKAVRIHAYGGLEALRYEDAPRPEPGSGDVLVRVLAAGVNPIDWKIRVGAFPDPGARFPMILGFDVCGVVDSVGGDGGDLRPGEEVYGMLALASGGAYAEFVAVPGKDLVRKPGNLEVSQAAAVPLAALTAWQALFDRAGLEAGQTVLIHGGSGGVGHFAVQFAKAKGARVVATASTGNQAFLKEIGADVAVDYRTQRFEDFARDVDVVLDSVGSDTLERSYPVVRRGGFIVSIVATPDAAKLEERGLRGSSMGVVPNPGELRAISKLIEEGKVKPHVGATFALADAAQAHAKSQAGGTPGKIVLLVRP